MSDGLAVILAALITAGVAGVGAGLHYLLQSARERGRADAYEESSRAAIEAKNAQIDQMRGECLGQLAEKDATIAYLRELLARREERDEERDEVRG